MFRARAIQVGELSSSHGSARCASGHWKNSSEDFFADCEQILGPSFSSFWLIQGCQCRWSKRKPKEIPSSLRNDLSRHLWVAIFVFQNEHQTTFQTGYLYRLKIRMMVGWEPNPMISWGAAAGSFPTVDPRAPWGWGIRESNRFPKSASTSSLSALPRTRFQTHSGYGPSGVYGKNSMVLESWLISWKKHGSAIWHLNVGIKFEGQPFKFRDEWRFGTKKSPGFQPREFPWNESPWTGSGVRAFTPLIYSDRPPKTCRKRGISVWRLILN